MSIKIERELNPEDVALFDSLFNFFSSFTEEELSTEDLEKIIINIRDLNIKLDK